jgi:hypothetical protein
LPAESPHLLHPPSIRGFAHPRSDSIDSVRHAGSQAALPRPQWFFNRNAGNGTRVGEPL